MSRSGNSWRVFIICAVVGCALWGAPAHAVDSIKVKGSTIEGNITALTAKGVEIEPAGTKGKLTVEYEDLEDIHTDGQYHVLHGDEEETVGRILEYKESTVLVGDTPETATRIQVEEVDWVISDEKYQSSWLARMRTQWRYWSLQYDLGYSAEDATTDTHSFNTGLHITRKKNPTRYYLDADYRYATQKPKNENQTTIKNYAYGGLRGEYDLTSKLYVFAAGSATYDGVQHLSIRGVPKGGVGYNFYETKQTLIQGEAGLAWVYERYFPLFKFPNSSSSENNYIAVAFGLRIATELWYGSQFTWNTDYLPAVDDFTGNYLLRTEATLLIPFYDPFNVKLSVLDAYTSIVPRDTDNNSLTTTVALAVVF